MRNREGIVVIILAVLMTFPAALAGQTFDYSKPFPLSLLDYSQAGGWRNPWPLDVENIQINSDSTTEVQNEEMVAINPTNTDNAVAIWRDFRLGYRRVGIGYTFDGGQTWHDTLLYVPPHDWQSDPVLVVDSSGNYFACTLGLDAGGGPSGIFVQESTDGGVSWSPPVTAVDGQMQFFEDKQMIVLDRSSSPAYGNIYISWTRFTSDLTSSWIVAVASRDGGESYSQPVQVSDAGGVQWSVPAVGPNGELYVAWFSYYPRGIYFDVSLDEGRTFGTDSFLLRTNASAREINGGILVFPFPALTCDVNPQSSYRGNLYIAYMDLNSVDMDIFFIKSVDNGISWSEPLRLNDDEIYNGADQFHPWLSVDDQGAIHAVFYDRRNDIAGNWLFDLYYTKSSDGGDTWAANERISNVSSDPSQASLAGLIGEYVGLSAWQGEVQMAWTDTRNGNQDVFSARLTPTGAVDAEPQLPSGLTLNAPYPNPFNNAVRITFNSSTERQVSLDIIDVLGRKVFGLFDGTCGAGANQFTWDGRDLDGLEVGSGVYYVRLSGDGFRQARKALLLR